MTGESPVPPQSPTLVANSDPTIVLSPLFKMVFKATFSLTLILLGAMIVLAAVFRSPSDQVKEVLSAVSTAFNLGVGALFGLIGGRAS